MLLYGTEPLHPLRRFPGILNPEFFDLDKPSKRVFEGTTYRSNKRLEEAVLEAVRSSSTWQAVAQEPVAPDMPRPDACFDESEEWLPRTCEVPAKPEPSQDDPLPYDPNAACSRQNSRRPWSSASPSARRSWAIRMGLRSASRGCDMWTGCGMPVRG